MDTWALIGIGATMAVVQVALFEVVRRRQKLVLAELFQATKNDRPSISRSAVEAALATIWQRTCLRRISIMAPMVGVVLTAAGFLSLQHWIPSEVRPGQEAVRSPIVGTLGPLYAGVLIGALSALVNQILVLILDVKAQGLQSLLWKRAAGDSGELPAASKSRTTTQASEEATLRVMQEMKDSLIEAMTRITAPVNQTANHLLDAGKGLAESQSRLQESVARFVTSTGEASFRLQETARSFQAGQEQLRGRFEEVLQSLQEVPDEFLKVATVWTSSLQSHVQESQVVTAQGSDANSSPSSERHAVMASLASSITRLSEQHTPTGDSLVGITDADGSISLEEVWAPHKSNRPPGLTSRDLDEHPRTETSKPELTTSANSIVPGFRLDHKRIHAIQSETEQVTEFLRAAMRDPETERTEPQLSFDSPQVSLPRVPFPTISMAEVSPQVNFPESDGDAADCFHELPRELRDFLRAASAHRAWTRSDLDQLSRQHRVMLGSAIERINEWSLNHLGDTLFLEQNESFLVQIDLL